ncbi:MAG TPA: anhydro-N-acetylmuramic acid kinase [Geminicoccaceae bacterium]|nr:anhydro-N-acetylmuramic acid kinase [Geminicoccaceae bacterium]
MVIRLAEVRALQARHVAGLMTGTSMDGLDVALCRIEPGPPFAWELLAFETVAPPEELRRELLALRRADVAGIARWHVQLGRFFADALGEVLARHPVEPHLIGSHGQTIYHEHGLTTLQIGEPSALAERFGCPVVSDFRHNDIAAGGCGAPLVPYVDLRLLGRPDRAVLAVNIGGISNFTAVPRLPADVDDLIGMDCGPGNMVLDRLAEVFSGGHLKCDVDGRFAAAGRVRDDLFRELAEHRFFRAPPPKSAGREQFGHAYVDDLLALVRPADDRDWFDLFATAAELTAFSIDEAYRRFVLPRLQVDEVVVSGGGARNPVLMARLARRFEPVPVRGSDAHGLSIDAKEAIAFAVFASERVDERPANVPAVTGARRRVLLGKITES